MRIERGIPKVMKNADVFIGLSAPNLITPDVLRKISKEPVVFALANPEPDIPPEEALPHSS
jgi:malic enzyme